MGYHVTFEKTPWHLLRQGSALGESSRQRDGPRLRRAGRGVPDPATGRRALYVRRGGCPGVLLSRLGRWRSRAQRQPDGSLSGVCASSRKGSLSFSAWKSAGRRRGQARCLCAAGRRARACW